MLHLLQSLVSRSTIWFALFTGTMSLVYKTTLWILRRVRKKDDKYNTIVASVLSSLALLVETDPFVRKLVCYYTFARSIDSFMRTLDSNKVVNVPKNWGLILYTLELTFFLVMYALHPDVVGQKIMKLFTKITFQKYNEKLMIQKTFVGINALSKYKI